MSPSPRRTACVRAFSLPHCGAPRAARRSSSGSRRSRRRPRAVRRSRRLQHGKVSAQQTAFVARAKGVATTFKELGRTQTALNAVIAQVDAESLAELSRDPAVLKISPVVDYQLDLSETVPYIGGTAVQGMGVTGDGMTVAVLDSGIDYTHAALRRPGHVPRVRERVRHEAQAREEPEDQRRLQGQEAVPDGQGRRRLRLRRRVLGRWRGQPARVQRSRPDPLRPGRDHGDLRRLPRHARRRHHRRQARASPRRRSCSRSRSAPRSAPPAPASR